MIRSDISICPVIVSSCLRSCLHAPYLFLHYFNWPRYGGDSRCVYWFVGVPATITNCRFLLAYEPVISGTGVLTVDFSHLFAQLSFMFNFAKLSVQVLYTKSKFALLWQHFHISVRSLSLLPTHNIQNLEKTVSG